MLRYSFFLVSFLFFSSCLTIGFQQPQPAGKKQLEEFPHALLGTYTDSPAGEEIALILRPNSVYLNDNETPAENDMYLSDSLVLKKFKRYYIANYWDKEKKCWIIYPFQGNQGRVMVYDLSLEKENAAKTLSGFTPLIRQDSDLIVVDPNRKALKRMLKDPTIWEIDTLYKMK